LTHFMDVLDEISRPKVEQKPWMKDIEFRLATPDDLDTIAQECIEAGVYGLDLEGTGLDSRAFPNDSGRLETVDKIVGYCIAPSITKGWYIPVRHREEGVEANVPPRLVVEMVRKIQAGGAVAVFHNAKYDHKLLDYDPLGPVGEWDDPDLWDDTVILAYLRNSRGKNKGLKHLSKVELGREMIELEDLFPPEAVKAKKLDFSTLDPQWEPALWYAASDAINTLYLRQKFIDAVVGKDDHGNSQRIMYRLEKACLRATLWMEQSRIHIDRDRLTGLIRLGQEEWWSSLVSVYDEASALLGRDVRPSWFHHMQDTFDPNVLQPNYMEAREIAQVGSTDDQKPSVEKSVPRIDDPRRQESVVFPAVYDVTIAANLGQMLRELGVKGLVATEKSGQVKTSKDVLDRVIEEAGDQFPFMKKIKRFREVAKGLGSNLFPIYWDSTPERSPDSCVYAGFNAHKVDTGRFSTPLPREKRKEFFHGQVRWNVHSTPATYDKSKPECVRRTREIVSARPGHVLFAIDYSGVELRIVTNLSGEPKWINEFFRCSSCDHTFPRDTRPPPFCPECGSDKIGDLHTLTAFGVFGEGIKGTEGFKQYRQQAKCVHPDTIIIRDGLPTRIGDLPFGDVDTFLPLPAGGEIQGPQGPIPLLESYNGGVKPLYHVVTRRGVVTCSDQHPFQTPQGLVSISEGLGPGTPLVDADPVSVEDGEYPTLDIPLRADVPVLQYTPDHAMSYVAGAYQGDGCKAGDRSVSIAHGTVRKKDRLGIPYAEWQDILSGALERAGFRPVRRKRSVYFGSRNTMAFMEFLGLLTRDGHRTLRVPPWIMQAGRKAILHYLAGLWDTDGYVSAKDGCGAWTTKDVVFAGQVAALLHAVGIKPRVEASWNKKYQKHYWRVHVTNQGMGEIGEQMRHPGKKARLRKQTRKNRSKPNEVLLVIPAGEGPCFDVHVGSEDHTFWCNGLVTRNSLNFAMCYGGGGSAAQRATGVSKEEGWRIKNQYDKTYRTLQKWWTYQHRTARQWKYVTTAYGRKYPLPDIDHEQGGFRSKAERNAVNGPVQGSSADIMKLAMALIYKEVKKRGWQDRVFMTITIHDELVFEIHDSLAGEAVEVIKQIMIEDAAKNLGWLVPLTVDVEFGDDWTVPNNLTEMMWNKGGKWTERWVRVFPKQYQHYLSCGGKPVDGAAEALPGDSPTQTPLAIEDAPQAPAKAPEREGSAYVFRVGKTSPSNAERLARVLFRCVGKGMDTLYVKDLTGNDLIGGPVKVAYEEFRVIADYEGLH